MVLSHFRSTKDKIDILVVVDMTYLLKSCFEICRTIGATIEASITVVMALLYSPILFIHEITNPINNLCFG